MFPTTILLRSNDPLPLVLFCVIGFVVGIVLFFHGFRLLQRRRLILDTPVSKIRSASLGMVEISGLAVAPYTLVAPITGRPCYYHRTLVWELRKNGKNSEWVKVAGECRHLPFFVDDNTGRMMVDPRGADLELHCDFRQEFCDSFFSTKEPVPSNVQAFLIRHGVTTENKIRVEEFCIKPKNALFVLGTVAENPGLEVTATPVLDAEPITSFTPQGFSFSFSLSSSRASQFQTGSPMNYFALHNHQPDPVQHVPATMMNESQQHIASAMVRAGISNPAAWHAAGLSPSVAAAATAAAAAPAIAKADPESASANFDLHPPVVLMKGANNKTFLISWRSQQEVARALGWKCTLMIWGGPLLASLCLYILLSIKSLL